MSKILTRCINKRLTVWAEENGKLYEEQCGFRKQRSTIDQIFTLQAIIRKYTSKKKGRYYCIFVDFSKAFDSVSHICLWYKLLKAGVHGRIINTLRSMYAKLQAAVVTPEGVAQFFNTLTGVRQGCQISPFLFNFYLNEFVDYCKEQGGQGVYMSEVFPNDMMLMYADDMVIWGYTEQEFKQKLQIIRFRF